MQERMAEDYEQQFQSVSSSYVDLKKRLADEEALRRKTRVMAAVITSIISAAGFSIVASKIYDISIEKLHVQPLAPSTELSQLRTRVDELQTQLAALQKPMSDSEPPIQQSKLAKEIKGVESRLAALEAVIVENPSRALAVPLLRKDIDELGARAIEYKATSRAEFDRLYEQQKWVLSGIGAVLLAVAGGALTILFRSLGKGKTGDKE